MPVLHGRETVQSLMTDLNMLLPCFREKMSAGAIVTEVLCTNFATEEGRRGDDGPLASVRSHSASPIASLSAATCMMHA